MSIKQESIEKHLIKRIKIKTSNFISGSDYWWSIAEKIKSISARESLASDFEVVGKDLRKAIDDINQDYRNEQKQKK